MDSPAGVIAGRFRLGELLGTGGSASVFDAWDDEADRAVALKILHPHLCRKPEARDAFAREAARAGGLRHPNVVGVLAVGVQDDADEPLCWIALDPVAGVTVAEHVTRYGPLEVGDALAVAEGMLLGLAAAHAIGLVHRDVSPSNVMLVSGTERGTERGTTPADVRLLDFGLADAAGRPALGTDDADGMIGVLGSVNYLSPEQARGLPVGESGDIYQVAGVLHFLLTGRPPFQRESAAAVLRAHVQSAPPVPSVLNSAVPRSVDRIVVKGMLKAPDSRFASADEMGAAVRAARQAGGAPLPDNAEEGARTLLLPESAHAARPGPVPAGLARAGLAVPTTSIPDDLTARLGPASVPPRSAGTSARSGTRRRTESGQLDMRSPARRVGPWLATILCAIGLTAVWSVAAAGAGGSSANPTPTATSESTPTSEPSAEPELLPPAQADTRVVMPELSTLTLSDAQARLVEVGLVAGELSVLNSATAGDTVLGMSIPAGTRVDPGSAVGLSVASGFNAVPALTGMTPDAAADAVRAAGFTVARLSVGTGAVPIGTVVEGRPAAGSIQRLGTAVTIVTATAPAETAAPTHPPTGEPSSPPVPPAG